MLNFFRRLLLKVDPEKAHTLGLQGLKWIHRLKLMPNYQFLSKEPIHIMGLTFKNRVGLAAGLDKNGDYIDALGALGFGHVEIGTVTPLPQLGNEKPRLFRLIEDEAIINRMGFNSKGAEYVLKRVSKRKYQGILGINIGKNKNTTIENAIDDYLQGFKLFAPYADYITINISSPNTEKLRELQQADNLIVLLDELKKQQLNFKNKHHKYVPLVVKIAPDLLQDELISMAHIFLKFKIDGVIATNTTISRPASLQSKYQVENGGLSGKPLFPLATSTLIILNQILNGQIPIIGVGGIMDKKTAQEKIQSGAQLVQIYTGFIFRGHDLIYQCL